MSDSFMRRAIELAQLGSGRVSPNPLVGCVIVHEGKIIGEGYHHTFGEPHAEVNAIRSVSDPLLLPKSTVYVTLEPCSHHGKTPPCTDLLIAHKVKRVVIACRDPFEKVNGKGIEKLKNAGIEVHEGSLFDEAKWMNRRFFTYHEKKRPFVILKWAQTKDGFIARGNSDSKWISNASSRQLVHKWRGENDAILVGKNTAIVDNPSLTTRDWSGRHPIRILLDYHLQTPESHHVFNSDADTIIFNGIKSQRKDTKEWVQLHNLHPESILKELYGRKNQSLIVEGGSAVLHSFLEADLWDEVRVFESKKLFGEGLSAPTLNKSPQEETMIRDDKLSIYTNNHG